MEKTNWIRQGKSISPQSSNMILPKQYLDVFRHYPAFRDLSDQANKTNY